MEGGLEGLIFILFAGALACILRTIWMYSRVLSRFPLTAALFFLGVGFSAWASESSLGRFGSSIRAAQDVSSTIILTVILPPLLYEAASTVDPHVFKRVFWSSAWLAGPAVLSTVALIAVPFKYITGWDWDYAITLGAILSATDPVAVVATIKELGAPKKLSTLIDGESLFNDGSAFVLFMILLEFIKGTSLSVGNIIVEFLLLAGVGILVGLVVAVCVSTWINFLIDVPVLEIAIVLSAVFGSALISELVFESSSILAVVAFGAFMALKGNYTLSPEAVEPIEAIFGQLSFFAESILFVLAGVISYDSIARGFALSTENTVGYLIALYLIMHVARAISIFASYPLLSRIGYGITVKESIFLVWGGLRGAVALSLILIVNSEESVPKDIADLIGFFVSGSVLLTLLINAPTAAAFFKWLAICRQNPVSELIFQRVMKYLEENDCIEESNRVRERWGLSVESFDCVKKITLDLRKLQLHGNRVIDLPKKSIIRTLSAMCKSDDFEKSHLEDSSEEEVNIEMKLKDLDPELKRQDSNFTENYSFSSLVSQRAYDILGLHAEMHAEEFSAEDLLLQMNESLFKVIRSHYLHQFETQTVSAESIVPLLEAASSAADLVPDLLDRAQENVSSKCIRRALKAEWEHVQKHVIHARLQKVLLHRFALPFTKFWIYEHVFRAADVCLGFYMAHKHALKHFQAFLPLALIEDLGLEADVQSASDELLKISHSFPKILMISRSVAAARTLTQKQKEMILRVRNEGYLDPDDADHVIAVLNARLGELSVVSRSVRLARVAV